MKKIIQILASLALALPAFSATQGTAVRAVDGYSTSQRLTNAVLAKPITYNQTNINVLTLGDDVLSEGSIRFWDGSDGQFYTLETQSGGLSVNGDFTSTTGFFGPGSGLQNLNADDVVNGQLQAQILSTNAPMAGAFLMASSSTNSRWSFDGSGLTNLPSSGSGIPTSAGSGTNTTFRGTVTNYATTANGSGGTYIRLKPTWTSNSTYAAPYEFTQTWNWQTTYDHDHPDVQTSIGYNMPGSPEYNPNEPSFYDSGESRWQNLDNYEQTELYSVYRAPTNVYGTNYSWRWRNFTPVFSTAAPTFQTYLDSSIAFESENFYVRPPNWGGDAPFKIVTARGVASASTTLKGVLTTETNVSNLGGMSLLGGTIRFGVPATVTDSSVSIGIDFKDSQGVAPDFFINAAGTAKAATTLGFTNFTLARNGIFIHGAQSRLQATNISTANITNTAVTDALAWGDANGKQGEATAANVASLWTGSGVYMTRFGTNADVSGGGGSVTNLAYANGTNLVSFVVSTDASFMYPNGSNALNIDGGSAGTFVFRRMDGSTILNLGANADFTPPTQFSVDIGDSTLLQNNGGIDYLFEGTDGFGVNGNDGFYVTNPDLVAGDFLYVSSNGGGTVRGTNAPTWAGMTITGNLSVGGGFIGLGAGVTNAAGFGMAGTNETRAVTFTNGASLFSGNYRAPTNGVSSGTWSTIGGLYITNVTSGNVTLGAFADVPANVAWSIPFFVTNGDTSVHDLIFPAGTRVNGTSIAPARYTVTNATALFGQVMGIGNLVTNVSAPNATGL